MNTAAQRLTPPAVAPANPWWRGATIYQIYPRSFLDTNGDGSLAFEEWAAKTTEKFAKADADASKILSREEFSTTKAKRSGKPRCDCPNEAN